MKFSHHSHRNAREIFQGSDNLKKIWDEITGIIESISDKDIKEKFLNNGGKTKSLSKTINELLSEKLCIEKWKVNAPMFDDNDYHGSNRFSLDFHKNNVGLEVAFNHEEGCAWNLIKTIITREDSAIEKNVVTEISIVITVKNNLRVSGGFDGSVGTYEKYISYLRPLNNILSGPIMIVGLEKLDSFVIKHKKSINKKIGILKEYTNMRGIL